MSDRYDGNRPLADIPLIVPPSGMIEREEKVWISSDGLHRVAAVKRPDEHFLVYSWYHWSVEAQKSMGFLTPTEFHWTADFDPTLYYDAEHEIHTPPVSGILECVEDAEIEALRILGINGS